MSLLHPYAPCNKVSACFRPRYRVPECRLATLCGRNDTEMPSLRNILPEHNVLSTVERRPSIRTSRSVIFHIRLAPLTWSLRRAIGRNRRIPHQRRSELDSHLQRRLQRGKRLPDTQYKAELEKFPSVVLLRKLVRSLLRRTSLKSRREQ